MVKNCVNFHREFNKEGGHLSIYSISTMVFTKEKEAQERGGPTKI